MNLILWRHAEAEDGKPDLARRLTEKGKQQARFMAEWLRSNLPRDDLKILVSPAVRTRETADALGVDYSVVDDIAPDVDPDNVLAAAGWPTAGGTVLVVGHQPTLGLVASTLLGGNESTSGLKKGAIVWIQSDDGKRNILHAALSPEK